jgi:hypothetical protein
MPEPEGGEFEKQVIQLADGRQLIYYRFASASSRPEPVPHPLDSRKPTPPREG